MKARVDERAVVAEHLARRRPRRVARGRRHLRRKRKAAFTARAEGAVLVRNAGFERAAGLRAQNDRLRAQRFLRVVLGHGRGEQGRDVFLQVQLEHTAFRADADAAGRYGRFGRREAAQPDENAQPDGDAKKKKQILFHRGQDSLQKLSFASKIFIQTPRNAYGGRIISARRSSNSRFSSATQAFRPTRALSTVHS